MLQSRPAGCQQMDARLNMHGRSSDIVLGLRAARLGSGSRTGRWEMDSPCVSRPRPKGLSGAFLLLLGEKAQVSARRRSDSRGMLKGQGVSGWRGDGTRERGRGEERRVGARRGLFVARGPGSGGPLGFLSLWSGAGSLAGLWARFLLSVRPSAARRRPCGRIQSGPGGWALGTARSGARGGNGAARRAEQMARPGRGQTMIPAARGVGARAGPGRVVCKSREKQDAVN